MSAPTGLGAPAAPVPPRHRVRRGRRTPLIVLLVASTTLVASAVAVAWSFGPAAGPTVGSAGGPANVRGMLRGLSGQSAGPVWSSGNGTAVTSIATARQRAAQAASGTGLHPGEVIWFDNGFYVELKDSSGQPATEVIVDPSSGAVTTEPGPAMMWNTSYSMMGGSMMGGSGTGMMGGRWGTSSGQSAAVTSDQAKVIAQQWLDVNRNGQSAQTADAYPGYYTMDTTTAGVIKGMLSVNATTGAVWYHTWHGRFVAKQDA